MILRPGHNVWRIEQAKRASVLIDAAAYFAAVRAALLKAQHNAFVVGWDVHSQTKLVGPSGNADDGYPECFADFLSALVRERPQLSVYLLEWDYSVLYAGEREFFPVYALRWNTPRGVRFSLDDAVPIGSSQHQKLVVIDDAIAFSGGLDITIRRWDTSKHAIDDPRRVDPSDKPYRPFHDVQILVDGDAAKAIAELARARWRCSTKENIPVAKPQTDPWPDQVKPDFTGLKIGIARTQPKYEEQKEVREVEALFLNSIKAAENCIYIENQFLSCAKMAEALAKRMRERPGLETVIVAPSRHDSWLEARSMRNGRIRFWNTLREAGLGDRVRLLYPEVTKGERSVGTMVHSKVMAVDDKLLRIGSANLNNRSMGTDTECDLVIEAENVTQRDQIIAVRNALIGDHCGASADEVAAAFGEKGSLVAVADTLTRGGHRLSAIDDGPPDHTELASYIEDIADPERPIGAENFVGDMFNGGNGRQRISTAIKVGAIVAVFIALALAWEFSPLSALAQPGVVREGLEYFAQGPWQPLIVLFVFVGGGLLLFPVTILVAATAAAFGPWLGFIYAAIGAMASAVITYALGARLGKESLRSVLGPKLNRIRAKVVRKGVIAIASIRLVPLAPFTVVNLVAGASEIRFSDYVLGTMLGLLPGLIVMSALGHQIARILSAPTAGEITLLVAAVAGWIVVSIGVQMLVTQLGSKKR